MHFNITLCISETFYIPTNALLHVMTGPSYPRTISWYAGQDLIQGVHQEQQTHQINQRRFNTSSAPTPHSYHTRQRTSTRQHQGERYGPYRHRDRRVRIQVKSRFRQSQSQSHSMGGFVSRGMKQMKSDGNGNFEQVPPPSQSESLQNLPVRLEMALDQPQEEKHEQVKHSWNPDDRSLNIFVKDNDPYTFHR